MWKNSCCFQSPPYTSDVPGNNTDVLYDHNTADFVAKTSNFLPSNYLIADYDKRSNLRIFLPDL